MQKFLARNSNFQGHVRLRGIDKTLLDIIIAWIEH